MTLPILLIFYVSKWKNNKKHWKIGIWRHCDVIIGRGKSKLSVGLLCTEMIIVCKFHDPSIIGSRDTEGGGVAPPPAPPVTDWPKKPSLNRVKCTHARVRVLIWTQSSCFVHFRYRADLGNFSFTVCWGVGLTGVMVDMKLSFFSVLSRLVSFVFCCCWFSLSGSLECFRFPSLRCLYLCHTAIENCHMGGIGISKQQQDFGYSWPSVRR